MNFFGENIGETLGVLLVIYWPLLAGLLSLALLAAAASQKVLFPLRVLCGAAGGGILLACVILLFPAMVA